MTRRWLGVRFEKLGAMVALLTFTATSFAAEPSTPTARQHYLSGAQLYAQGKYSDAVDQFLAADRMAPSAALSYDIARAYEKLGETSLALRWYRDYLHRAGEPADAPKLRRVVDSLERVLRNKGVQQITVRSGPAPLRPSGAPEACGYAVWREGKGPSSN